MREAGIDAPDYQTFVRSIQPTLPDDQQLVAIECQKMAFAGPPPE